MRSCGSRSLRTAQQRDCTQPTALGHGHQLRKSADGSRLSETQSPERALTPPSCPGQRAPSGSAPERPGRVRSHSKAGPAGWGALRRAGRRMLTVRLRVQLVLGGRPSPSRTRGRLQSMQDRRDAGSPGEASSQSREFESEAKPATARAVSYGSAKETGSPNEDQGDSRVPWTRPRGAQFP